MKDTKMDNTSPEQQAQSYQRPASGEAGVHGAYDGRHRHLGLQYNPMRRATGNDTVGIILVAMETVNNLHGSRVSHGDGGI